MSRALKRYLSITAWNANGIGSRHSELLEFIAPFKPDVLLFYETHLTPAKPFRLPNYMCYRDDRIDGPGGGTPDAVKVSIAHYRVLLPQRTHLEVTAIDVHGAHGGVLLVPGYKPPLKELLVPDLEVVFDAHRRMIVAGDLSCKHLDWNSRVTAPNGKCFVGSCRRMVIGPFTDVYPAMTNANPDVLDIAVTQEIVCPVEIISLTELSSDRNPISIHVAT